MVSTRRVVAIAALPSSAVDDQEPAPVRPVRCSQPGVAETIRAGGEPPNFFFPLVQTAALRALTEKAGLPAKVTVISAPTGYGKTVLQTALFNHVREQGFRAIWICLDERDQTTRQVLEHLERAFRREQEALNLASAIHLSDEPMEQRIDALLEVIARLHVDTVLFLDNLNCCSDDTVGQLLDALVSGTPGRFQVVLGGTVDPPVNLSRLKLEGRLSRITFADLAFDEAGIRTLFGVDLCARLGDSGIRSVVRRTEGWPAAVRLMQIILASAPSPVQTLATFSGSDTDLADMLNRQVLAAFDPETRKFLLEIAGLRSFCIPLCRHATGDGRASEHIMRLLERNVFVIPLDRNRTWYRLHALFRQFLVAEAERKLAPDRQRQVLLRAAEWCEQGGHWSDAIEYALAADEFEAVAGILERVAQYFVRDRGDLHKYIGWVETLKAAGTAVGWEAEFWYVWALVFHRRYEFARRQIDSLSARIQIGAVEDRGNGRAIERQRRLEIIRIIANIYVDRLDEAEEHGRLWLAQCSDSDDPFDVATMGCVTGVNRWAHFDLAGAREMFAMAQTACAQASSEYGESWIGTLTYLVPMLEGDFAAAYEGVRRTLERARASMGDGAGATATVAFVAARCAVEVGLDAEAREWLDIGMRRAYVHGVVETAAAGLEAAVKLWASPMGMNISISELREIAASYPQRLSVMLSCFLVQRLLRLRRIDDAQSEAAKIGIVAGAEFTIINTLPLCRFLLVQTQIEIDIATGRLHQAEARIAEETVAAREQGRCGHLVELALCEMAISMSGSNPSAAVRHFTRAVRYAAKRRYLRPFRDRVELIASIVNDTKPQSLGFVLEEERKFFSEICRMLPISNSLLLEQLERLNIEAAILEKPTPRELELLALIDAGLSNQQLADRLSVSIATVKWHLSNLYAKLSASSRAAALAKARALNLLSR